MSAKVERDIQLFAVYSRCFVIILQIVFNAVIPDHDAGVFNPPPSPLTSKTSLDDVVDFLLGGFRRWDAVYFIHIAEHGYTYENTVAFFPLFPLIVGKVTDMVSLFSNPYLSTRNVALMTAVIINFFLFIKTAQVLFRLGIFVLKDEKLAYKSALLFCINPASVFFSAGYSETLYAFILFSGMLYASRGRNLIASALFGLATGARSNGVVALGFVAHAVGKIVLEQIYFIYYLKIPVITRTLKALIVIVKNLIVSIIYLFICLIPFAIYQYYIYTLFCGNKTRPSAYHIEEYGRIQNYSLAGDESSEWCSYSVPLSYSYIQSKHWDVGFLHYYQLKQIPNFILGAPVIFLSFTACLDYYRQNKIVCHQLGFLSDVHVKKTDDRNGGTGYSSNLLLPFIVHLLVLTVFGCLFIHIQVLTRVLFSSSPILYWYSAYCMTSRTRPRLHYFKSEERKYIKTREGLSHKNTIIFNDLYYWNGLNINSKLIYTYFFSYIVIGTAAFSNFLPWT